MQAVPDRLGVGAVGSEQLGQSRFEQRQDGGPAVTDGVGEAGPTTPSTVSTSIVTISMWEISYWLAPMRCDPHQTSRGMR